MIKVEKTWLTGIGAVASTLLAHVPCCGLNLALLVGAAGSGTSFLSGLTPFRPWFIGFSILMSAVTLWLAFKPHKSHACGECCHVETHDKRSWVKKTAALVLAAVSLAGIFWAPTRHIHVPGDEAAHSHVD